MLLGNGQLSRCLFISQHNPWPSHQGIKFLKNALLISPNSPLFVLVCFYLYHLSCFIVVCTLLVFKNNWSTRTRVQVIAAGGYKCANCLYLVRFVSALACIFNVGGIKNISRGMHRAQVRNIHCLRLEPHRLRIWARYTDWWPKTYIHTYVYEVIFLTVVKLCHCPFPGFPGTSRSRGGLQNHFIWIHWGGQKPNIGGSPDAVSAL